MCIKDLAVRLVDVCNRGKNFDVMHTMHDDNIVSVAPTDKATNGKEPVIKKSERSAETVEFHGQTVIGPFFHSDDRFATHEQKTRQARCSIGPVPR